jgi:hypothetical protein
MRAIPSSRLSGLIRIRFRIPIGFPDPVFPLKTWNFLEGESKKDHCPREISTRPPSKIIGYLLKFGEVYEFTNLLNSPNLIIVIFPGYSPVLIYPKEN